MSGKVEELRRRGYACRDLYGVTWCMHSSWLDFDGYTVERVVERVLDELVLPAEVDDKDVPLSYPHCAARTEAAGVALEAVYYVGTSESAAYLRALAAGPVASALRLAVKRTWVETAAAAVVTPAPVPEAEVVEWKDGVELDTIEAPCQGMHRDGVCRFRWPRKVFEEAVRSTPADKILSAIAEALEELERFERMVRESVERGELELEAAEQLKSIARRSLLPVDELDLE